MQARPFATDICAVARPLAPRVAALALAAIVAIGAASRTALAQHAGGSEPTATRAPAEANQFDFLVGQWDLVVAPQGSGLAAMIHGVPTMKGTWKAWRALEGWGLEDELRVVDASGNPRALTLSIRLYSAADKKWKVAATDAYRGTITLSTATWSAGTMEHTALAPSTDANGKSFVGRTRITDVTPKSFKYLQERSYDGGTKWEATLKIDATRVAATAPR